MTFVFVIINGTRSSNRGNRNDSDINGKSANDSYGNSSHRKDSNINDRIM